MSNLWSKVEAEKADWTGPEPRPAYVPMCVDYGLTKSVEPDVKFRLQWLGDDPRSHPEVQQMRIETELWVKRCLNDKLHGRLLVLSGRFGTGKSRVARKAVKAIQAMGIAAWYEKLRRQTIAAHAFNWSELAQIGPMERNDQSAWIDAVEVGAALIDDIGTEVDKFKSGSTTENLRLLLEARRDLWTIYTTNIPPDKWAECWDRRVDDRLHRNSVIVTLPTTQSWTQL